MAMLRSSIRLALRQSAPPSHFLGNAGRRNPASSITLKRNYFHGNDYDLRKEDFMNWNSMEFLLSMVGLSVGLLFYHNVRESRYNAAQYEKKSTSDTGPCGQEKVEKKELSEASMSN